MKDLLMDEYLGDFGREADYCSICTVHDLEKNLETVWKDNPFGAEKGKVISHLVCKDKEACAKRCSSVDWKKVC